MSKPFVPIQTASIQWRSNLPFSSVYEDVYHSMDSGIEHSLYTFINGNNLIARWKSLSKSNALFSIGETGFGTGLNFLLTWSLWEKHAPYTAHLHFISCEKHPLTRRDLEKSLNNWPELEPYKNKLLEQYPVLTPGNHTLLFSNGRVKLTLMLGDCYERFEQLALCGDSLMEHQLRTAFIDAWFLDGFAPKKNEAMWSKALIQVLTMLSKQGTTFATYTAAAIVKSHLQECGFIIEKRKGHRAKRHMLVGHWEHLASCRTQHRNTPWHVSKAPYLNARTAVIVGAGLAGCFAAHVLAQKGWHVTLLEEKETIAQGASGNERAVLFPKLSAYQSPFTEFMLASFLYAHRLYREVLQKHSLGELKGAITLPYNNKEQHAQEGLTHWLECYPELGQLVSCEQANELSGLAINKSGLYIPLSGWLNSPLLCQYLTDHPNIHVMTNSSIERLDFKEGYWMVNNHQSSVVILANGFKVNQFCQTKCLPIKPIRGQMTSISSTSLSNSLKIPVCAEGHVLPAIEGVHFLGATYQLGIETTYQTPEDDQQNLKKLTDIDAQDIWSNQVESSWVGIRASTPDYLPLVGPVPIVESFKTVYAGLQSNAKRWVPKEAAYYPGLYAFAGFGSRGLTTIPLAAEWLGALINNELHGAPRNLMHALSPARFIIRSIIRGQAFTENPFVAAVE